MTGITPPRKGLSRAPQVALSRSVGYTAAYRRQNPARNPVTPLTKNLVLILFIGALAVFAARQLSAALQATDFPDFYCAARMLADGQGPHLYDAATQRQYQARYSARVGTLYIHPPFEAIVYLAVAWLPLQSAYVLWFVLSLGFLAIADYTFAHAALKDWNWHWLFVAAVTFAPVLLCLIQGQDSLLLLLLVVAFLNLRRGRAFAAGCWLGLALFKFQIAVPLGIMLLFAWGAKARWHFARGLVLVGAVLAAISAVLCGGRVFAAYPAFLLHLKTDRYAGIYPEAMGNLRGLIYLFFHRDQSAIAVAILAAASVGLLLKSIAEWRRVPAIPDDPISERELDRAFANSILVALLVSYHLNPHDLSLLMIPIALVLKDRSWLAEKGFARGMTPALLALIFLPLLHIWALKTAVYGLVALPLLGLLARNRRPQQI